MKRWETDIIINTYIDNVWKVIDGSEENLKKLDPKIIKNVIIEETENKVGSRYLQQYKEGKKVMEYEVVVLEHKDTEDHKQFKIGFTIGNWFEVTVEYILFKVSEEETKLIYITTNNPLKLFAKMMLFLMPSGTKMIDDHVKKIKNLAEDGSEFGDQIYGL